MPKVIWIIVLAACFGFSLIGSASQAGDSGTIQATATVVAAVGFDRDLSIGAEQTNCDEVFPAIRITEDIGLICNINYGDGGSVNLHFDGKSNGPAGCNAMPAPAVSWFDLTPFLRGRSESADSCLITIIYSEN